MLKTLQSVYLMYQTAASNVYQVLATYGMKEVASNFLHTVHVMPRCRSPNPCLPQQQGTIPYAVKISVLRS